MPAVNQKVMAMVERELKKNPKVKASELQAKAKKISKNVPVIVLRDGELTARDPESGVIRWKTRLYYGDDRYAGIVRIDKDVQVIDRHRGRLVGIEPDSGRILWTQEIKPSSDVPTSGATSSTTRDVRWFASRVATLEEERDALEKRLEKLSEANLQLQIQLRALRQVDSRHAEK